MADGRRRGDRRRRSSRHCTTRSPRSGAEIAVGELPPAWGDPTAVEQVFANLIGNALQYLDPARPGRIEMGSIDSPPSGTIADGCEVYCVRDNGLGIPAGLSPAHVHRLQPASRGRGPRRRHRAGPGAADGRAARRPDLARVRGRGRHHFLRRPAGHQGPTKLGRNHGAAAFPRSGHKRRSSAMAPNRS